MQDWVSLLNKWAGCLRCHPVALLYASLPNTAAVVQDGVSQGAGGVYVQYHSHSLKEGLAN